MPRRAHPETNRAAWGGPASANPRGGAVLDHEIRRPHLSASVFPARLRPASAHFGGWTSLLSQRVVLVVFMGSDQSQSKQESARCPLPLGGSARIRSAPQWGQVGRLAWPMAKILRRRAGPSTEQAIRQTYGCIGTVE